MALRVIVWMNRGRFGPVLRKNSLHRAFRADKLPTCRQDCSRLRYRTQAGSGWVHATYTSVSSPRAGYDLARDGPRAVSQRQPPDSDGPGRRESVPPEILGPVPRAAGETSARFRPAPAHARPLRALLRLARGPHHRPAGHAGALAPRSLPALLALAVATRPAPAPGGAPAVDCRHGPRQPDLGRGVEEGAKQPVKGGRPSCGITPRPSWPATSAWW